MQNLTKKQKKKKRNAKIDNDKLCFNSVTDDEKKCTNKENSARWGGITACTNWGVSEVEADVPPMG